MKRFSATGTMDNAKEAQNGHSFITSTTYTVCLTGSELQWLFLYFCHPSTRQLFNLLMGARLHEPDVNVRGMLDVFPPPVNLGKIILLHHCSPAQL